MSWLWNNIVAPTVRLATDAVVDVGAGVVFLGNHATNAVHLTNNDPNVHFDNATAIKDGMDDCGALDSVKKRVYENHFKGTIQ